MRIGRVLTGLILEGWPVFIILFPSMSLLIGRMASIYHICLCYQK